jgi:hypothetical protein
MAANERHSGSGMNSTTKRKDRSPQRTQSPQRKEDTKGKKKGTKKNGTRGLKAAWLHNPGFVCLCAFLFILCAFSSFFFVPFVFFVVNFF